MVRQSLRAFTCLVSLGLFAGTAAAESDAASQEKAAKLAAAIEACDKAAAIPLDADAKAPAILFEDLFPPDFNVSALRMTAQKCLEAALDAPDQKRLKLQWLRAKVALQDPDVPALAEQIRVFAEAGSAEANYLLYELFRRYRLEPDKLPVTREEGLAALQKAAASGHFSALRELVHQYMSGPLLKRDYLKAVEAEKLLLAAPLQAPGSAPHEAQFKESLPLLIAIHTIEHDGFSAEDQQEAFSLIDQRTKTGTEGGSPLVIAYAEALRFGKGTTKDPERAKQILEGQQQKDAYAIPPLAEMIAHGEAGPPDGKAALALLRDPRLKDNFEANRVLATLLMDGKTVGTQPQEAIRLLASDYSIDSQIRLAALLIDYHPRIDSADRLLATLEDAAIAGEPGAALALARLKLSDNSQFTDVDGARVILKAASDAGEREALWLYAASQYSNLDSSSSQPFRREGGLSDEDLQHLLKEGSDRKEAQAFLLLAKFLRRGVVYPQDDEQATRQLISAANLGSVEAMVLLGDAYDDGLGIEKNPRERLHAWREAAKLGSLEARKKLASAFTFDSFDKLLTLREGVTERIALYINDAPASSGAGFFGAEMELMGMFSGRAGEAGVDPAAAAVMDAFREAPAGLEDRLLVDIVKALPEEIRVAIEKRLQQEGFYKGEPKGYFGPEVRAALAGWVDAKGPLGEDATPQAASASTARTEGAVPSDVLDRARDQAFKKAMDAKTDKQKLAALKLVNMLARYGDTAARWAILRNYHQARAVRKVVTPAEVSRYGLDILVSKPEGIEKADFEFIFVLTRLAQDGKANAFGEALIAAMRDDARLQDPLTFGGIAQQLIFAPGACDAILAAAKKAGVDGIGSDGCDEDTRAALIAFAKEKGPAGIEDAARKGAAKEIVALGEKAK